MLRIVASRSSEQALSYYGEALSREDYYAGEAESEGRWGGEAARRLGLSGRVDRESFEALVANRDPMTGEQLTARQNTDRRVGYDFNFHCPKSVSLVHALTDDPRIREVFQESVRETMQQLEHDMQTRIRKDRQQADRTTGNMAWAQFIHQTARPVDGVPDPHLHAHCFVFNATYDEEEQRWKAGQFGNIKRDAPYYEACFHARFAERIRDLGYGIERNAEGWEIAGISRGMIERFSQRTAQVKEAAEELGITDKAKLDQLGARTREAKRKDLSLDDLREEWNARLTDEERGMLARVRDDRERNVHRTPHIEASDCLDHAAKHHFERASVVSERRLLAEALWRGVGSTSVKEIHEACEQKDYLRSVHEGERVVTTREVLAEEKAMVNSVRLWRGTLRPIKPEHEFIQQNLSEEQKNAVRHVLESTDRVTGIRGGAGTGKTSLMREAVTAMRGCGLEVFVFAPSVEASRKVLREEGFDGADTVARLLADQELQAAIRDQVVWVDEAGLLGTRTMKRIIDLVREKNARLILSGDTRQHRSVERGDSLRLLQEKAGLACAELRTIHRQSGDYREAILAISEDRVESGFEKLEALGAIRELDSLERYAELAEEYIAARQKGETALIVSPTHREAEQVTDALRTAMRGAGMLAAVEEERVVPRFRSLNLTEAERSDPANYAPGMYINFTRNAPGFQKSQKWIVREVGDDEVRIADAEGNLQQLPLRMADRFEVFTATELKLAKGDRIQLQRDGKTLQGNRIHKGDVKDVVGFDEDGNIVLDNGWTIPRDFGQIGYGFVLTSHASQGKTVDHVFVAQGSDSWNASSREQFYVTASRGRRSIRVYTDNKEALLDAVLSSSARLSAMELEFGESRPEVAATTARKERERTIRTPDQEPAEPTREASPVVEPDPDQGAPAAENPRPSKMEPPQEAPRATPQPKPVMPKPEPPLPASPPPPPAPKAPSSGIAPKAPTISEIIRAQELLAKYAGRGVSSPTDQATPEGERHWLRLVDKYTHRNPARDEQERDEQRRREQDRERSE